MRLAWCGPVSLGLTALIRSVTGQGGALGHWLSSTKVNTRYRHTHLLQRTILLVQNNHLSSNVLPWYDSLTQTFAYAVPNTVRRKPETLLQPMARC